ncbi:diacylglycerol kinase family protein [Paenibacillus sp. IB182496]|uniref:Diacylglycerol kinase family protein n=1 Tax=Paenibacillus sabuli TaxID=2772509 RepID=A0A927BQL3_9BACL|nr:diacylglycerol kinase family protein [Paenibacillus sabuli]MBD2844447.1 diacylglycerol kinase family protein [Paenibacillus sabuli]
MRRFLSSAKYAVSGLAYAVRTQRHMRFHLGAAAAVLTTAAVLGVSRQSWALLIGACCIVIAAELTNTAIERLVDLASPELHPLAKAAKDTAAAAVLIMALGAAVIGLLVLGPPLAERLGWLEFNN